MSVVRVGEYAALGRNLQDVWLCVNDPSHAASSNDRFRWRIKDEYIRICFLICYLTETYEVTPFTLSFFPPDHPSWPRMRSIQERQEVCGALMLLISSNMTRTARSALQIGVRCVILVTICSPLSISAVTRPRCDQYIKAGVKMRSSQLLLIPSAISRRMMLITSFLKIFCNL